MFVLAFCVFRKETYIRDLCPAIQAFKFKYWGHDSVVLHEREIRKSLGPFSLLRDPRIRSAFMHDLNALLHHAEFTIQAVAIRKLALQERYTHPDNPYVHALRFGLERLATHLGELNQQGRRTHVVVESRGKKEDADLRQAFEGICEDPSLSRIPFDLGMLPKGSNSAGMQISDLVARPIGLKVLRPEQRNRAYEILETKLRRDSAGRIHDLGLKVFPE